MTVNIRLLALSARLACIATAGGLLAGVAPCENPCEQARAALLAVEVLQPFPPINYPFEGCAEIPAQVFRDAGPIECPELLVARFRIGGLPCNGAFLRIFLSPSPPNQRAHFTIQREEFGRVRKETAWIPMTITCIDSQLHVIMTGSLDFEPFKRDCTIVDGGVSGSECVPFYTPGGIPATRSRVIPKSATIQPALPRKAPSDAGQ